MTPPKIPRPGSSPRLNVTEEVSAGAFREYREPSVADRPTAPQPSERRPPVSNRPPAEIPVAPPAYRRDPPEDNPSNARPWPHPPLPVAARAQTLTGMPAPPSEPPERSLRDSREITQDALLQEYKEEAEARRAAERRASELQLKLAAAESGVHAQGPTLGSAKWWAVVIGALAIAAPQVKELIRPSASAAQISAVQQSLADITKRLDTRDTAIEADAKAEAKRWTISAAFACSQGLRARGLDCDAAQAYADIQPQPLKPKVAPTWKATALWPIVPTPKD